MATAAELLVLIKAKDDASHTIDHVTGKVGGFRQAITQASATFAGFLSAQAAVSGIRAAWNATSSALIGFNSQLQNASIAFTTMTGSAKAAQTLLTDLQKFAATTPFQFDQLVLASQRLMAFGFSAQDVIPTLKAVGDASANMGNVSAESINRIVLALGQMAARGKVSGGELLQLSEAGINGLAILAEGFGKTTGEMQKMVEAGLVPADRGIKLLVEGMEKNAPDAMAKMSATWSGATSNIKDSIQQLMAGALRPLFDLLTAGANKLADFLSSPQVKAAAADLSTMFTALSRGLSLVFAGREDDASGWFALVRQKLSVLANEAKLAFLSIANAATVMIGPVTSAFLSLAGAAVSWGAELVVGFARGMVDAAASVLDSALTGIMNLVADYFPHSPAKKGPFKDIYVFGADILNSLFAGMSKADFSALDRIMGAVRDVLTAQVNSGALPENGLIPALIGSESMVAAALAQMRQFGSVAEDVFGQLRGFLGGAGDDVETLVRQMIELAGTEQQIEALTAQIDDLEGQLRTLTRAYEDSKRPIEDRMRVVERAYDIEIDKIDRATAALRRQRDAMLAANEPQLTALNHEELLAQLAADKARLAEAQTAHLARHARLTDDVAAAQARLTAATKRGDAVAVTKAQHDLEAAMNRLGTEGVQTAEDRLAIIRAEQAVLRDQNAIRTEGLDNEIDKAERQKGLLRDQRTEELAPLKDDLSAITDQYEAGKRAIEDQLRPLTDQRDVLRDQAQAQQSVVDLAISRLGHERAVTDEIKKQVDLLNREATAGGGGGAGAAALGGAGLKNGLGLRGGKSSEKSFEDVEAEAAAKSAREEALNRQVQAIADRFKKNLQTQLSKSVREAWRHAFSKENTPEIVGGGLGAAIGLYFGGPGGAMLGGLLGASIGRALKGVDWAAVTEPFRGIIDAAKPVLMEIWNTVKEIVGGIAGYFVENGPIFIDAILNIAETLKAVFGPPLMMLIPVVRELWEIVRTLGEVLLTVLGGALKAVAQLINGDFRGAFDTVVVMLRNVMTTLGDWIAHIIPTLYSLGEDIIGGVMEGIAAAGKDLWDGIVRLFWGAVNAVKEMLGISSPSTVFMEIGTSIIEGLWEGVKAAWDAGVSFLLGLGGMALAAVGNLSSLLLSTGQDLLSGLWSGVKVVWEGAIGLAQWFTDLPGNTIKAIGNVAETLKGVGELLLKGLLAGLKAWWEFEQGLGAWLRELPTLIKDTLEKLAGGPLKWLWNLGYDVGKGLVDGAVAAIKGLGHMIKDALPSIPNPFDRKSAASTGGDDAGSAGTPGAAAAAMGAAAGAAFAEAAMPSMSRNYQIDTSGLPSVRVGETTNAFGLAGLTHTTFSEGDWQVELFNITAALAAVSSQFTDMARRGAYPAGTDLPTALGFTSKAAYDQWMAVAQKEAANNVVKFAQAQGAFHQTSGGGMTAGDIMAGMTDQQFEGFLNSLPTGERERARQERERAQEQQTAAARGQQQAADDQKDAGWKQGEAGDQQKENADQIGETLAALPTPEDWQQAREDAAAAGADDRADDEDQKRKKKKEEEDDGKGAVPAHAAGGIISEFARLVNAAGRTIGTMSEAGPEAIVPLPLLHGAMAALTPLSAPGPSAMQSPVGGEGVAVQIGHAVAAALAGVTVEMDGQTVGRLVAPHVSREIARDALLAGVNR